MVVGDLPTSIGMSNTSPRRPTPPISSSRALARRHGKLARIIHLYDGSTGKPVGSIPTTIPPDDSATGMRFDPEGTRLCVPTKVRSPADLFEVPSLRSLGPVEVDGSLNVGGSRGVGYSARHPTRRGWSS